MKRILMITAIALCMASPAIAKGQYAKPSPQALFVAKHPDSSHCRGINDFFDFVDAHKLVQIGAKGNRYTYMDPQQHILIVDVSANEACFVAAK